jgi:hypothetical protein
MGYLPAKLAKILAPMMDAGRTFLAEFGVAIGTLLAFQQ